MVRLVVAVLRRHLGSFFFRDGRCWVEIARWLCQNAVEIEVILCESRSINTGKTAKEVWVSEGILEAAWIFRRTQRKTFLMTWHVRMPANMFIEILQKHTNIVFRLIDVADLWLWLQNNNRRDRKRDSRFIFYRTTEFSVGANQAKENSSKAVGNKRLSLSQ